MDNGVAVLLGALLAIVGGLLFRSMEATHQQRAWFRDRLREAAEQFLAEAEEHLRTSGYVLGGNTPTSGHVENVEMRLAVDISRLRFVAPESVLKAANEVTTKVKAALKVAKSGQKSWGPTLEGDEEKQKAAKMVAEAAINEANLELRRFVDLVKGELGKG